MHNGIRIETAVGGLAAAAVIGKRFYERGVTLSDSGFKIVLDKGPVPGEGGFMLSEEEGGVRITADSIIGVLHGAGYFLRGCVFDDGGFEPCAFRGLKIPECPIRTVYLAHHFGNYYHKADAVRLGRCLEDMALWGISGIHLNVAEIDIESEESPELKDEIDKISEVFRYAKTLGMTTSTGLLVNQVFKKFPQEYGFKPVADPLGRHGNTGNMLCLSVPGAQEYADSLNRRMLAAYRENSAPIDFVRAWPYDEGGCGCEKCAPGGNWGGNGYIKGAKSAFRTARELYPDVQRVLSTWTFDTPPCGEWEALTESLKKEKWCDVILADAHEDFPRYPLDHGVPGGLPMISFPEISMWGLYPWGGWGANPLPARFTRLWRQTGHMLSGESAYSEGIYEDINKCVIANLTWNYEADPDETLAQYARFELGMKGDAALFVRLISLIEKTHTAAAGGRCDPADSDEAFAIAGTIDRSLPEWGKTGWKWRIVYLRALLDCRRYRLAAEKAGPGNNFNADYKSLLAGDRPSQDAFAELIEIFLCEKNYSGDPYHCRVRPLTD